jgi:hypothetical protein
MTKKVFQYLAAPVSLTIGIAVAWGIAEATQKSFEELWAMYVLIPTLFVALAVLALRRPDIFKPYERHDDPWNSTELNEQAQQAAAPQPADAVIEPTPEEEPGEYIRFKCQWTKYVADVSKLLRTGDGGYRKRFIHVSPETIKDHEVFSSSWIKNHEHHVMLERIPLPHPRDVLTKEELRRADVYGVSIDNVYALLMQKIYRAPVDIAIIRLPVHPKELRNKGSYFYYPMFVRQQFDAAIHAAKEHHMDRVRSVMNLHEHRTLHPAKRRSSYTPPRW